MSGGFQFKNVIQRVLTTTGHVTDVAGDDIDNESKRQVFITGKPRNGLPVFIVSTFIINKYYMDRNIQKITGKISLHAETINNYIVSKIFQEWNYP